MNAWRISVFSGLPGHSRLFTRCAFGTRAKLSSASGCIGAAPNTLLNVVCVSADGTQFMNTMKAKTLENSGGAIRLMTVGNTGGWRNFANTQRRVQGPGDLAGLKIRTVVADLPQELVKALGASPTPIPWPELFTSLQTGVVEGSKNGITDIMGMKFPDAGLQYVTLDGHAYMGALWFMNNEKFQLMPDDLKRVVIDGFYQLQQATFASPKRKSIKAYQDFVAGGGERMMSRQAGGTYLRLNASMDAAG